MHLWFFASPVLYYHQDVPDRVRQVLRFNPMWHIVISYQEMLFHGSFQHWRGLLLTGAVALVAFGVGLLFFERLRDTLAEEV
jgi:teichoic acid transport system permease protein